MCNKCSVTYRVSTVCPPDREQMLVTSEHIRATDPDSAIVPVCYEEDEGKQEEPISFMLLSRNQQLDMQIVAKKGIGKIHAKWSPVSTCIMRKQPQVVINHESVNKKLTIDQRKEFVSKCPRKVFKMNEFKQEVEIENAANCSLCQECTKYASEVNLPSASVVIGENDSRFLFTVEGTGALPPEEIV